MNKDWLEICSGHNPTDGYIHLDADPNSPHVEIVGDIRTIFIPQDFPNINDYPDLLPLKPSTQNDELLLYNKIKLMHIVEHFHWYNQPYMWRWLYQLLDYDGILEIETPDLEWIVKTYYKNLNSKWYNIIRRWLLRRSTKNIKFPQEDHPDITGDSIEDLSKWFCFKIYSGGSFEQNAKIHDYHLGVYDRFRLKQELLQAGFVCRIARDFWHGTLKAIARKKIENRKKDYYDEEPV